MVWMVSVLMVSVSLYSTGERANPMMVKRNVVLMAERTPVKFTFLVKVKDI